MALQDLFLELKGIEGEAKDQVRSGLIQLDSYSFNGTSPRDEATGQATGRVHMRPFICVKKIDKSSPKLLDALAKNQKIPNATLFVRKAGKGQQDYLTYELEEVYVTSLSVSGAAGGESEVPIPTESFQLIYGKMVVTYKEQSSLGSLIGAVSGSVDLRTGMR